ncbi:ALG6, ALG8 glycosyltransferase [Martensiomyces pterosporus]|nr:ALG6, ALG8 glycosyltransferase [Martensiomyces pterosporus]
MLYDIAVLGVGLAAKLLLLPAYHSTDFEVHRNWLAITSSLPVEKWYFEDRSEWTLDYPPFFAWFEWTMSHFARWWDPRIVDIDRLGYASESCVVFQRLSVITSELVLYFALRRFVRIHGSTTQSKVAAALAFLSPGFLFVDHVHFQYNGFLFGILVYSMVFALEGRDLLAGGAFAVLLCFKHIFMYIAPAYFGYLLVHYCIVYHADSRRKSTQKGFQQRSRINIGSSVFRLVKLGSLVALVFGIAFGPFIAMRQMPQLASRLFPFKRGLTHAFWAPNFWALYTFADRALIVASRLFPRLVPSNAANMGSSTRGLVGDTGFAVLPDVLPLTTFVATLVAQAPACAILARKKCTPPRLIQSVVLCAYASFMFGWHVHEKAVMLILVPLSLLVAAPTPLTLRMFTVLAISGYYSLFPLLFGAQELVIKLALMLIWSLCSLALLKSKGVSAWRCLSGIERLYIAGHIPLFIVSELTPGVFGRLQFLPLALVSVYTALGVTYSWIGFVYECLSA